MALILTHRNAEGLNRRPERNFGDAFPQTHTSMKEQNSSHKTPQRPKHTGSMLELGENMNNAANIEVHFIPSLRK